MNAVSLTSTHGQMLDIAGADNGRELLPAYLRDVYTWAYLTPGLTGWLDRQVVVQTILWGNAQRLINDVLACLKPGDTVFQPAAVYGDFSRQVARLVGPGGRLEVRDIAPLQVGLTRRKLADLPQAHVAQADAAAPEHGAFDVVACFFLLHEVPEDVRSRIVHGMLGLVGPGGKAVFVDYHKPKWWHPLKPLMTWIYRTLEPYALSLWPQEIETIAGDQGTGFRWRKHTRFGGLYQTVIAERV